MDHKYCVFLYKDGNICQGNNGMAFEGGQPLGMIIEEGCNLDGLMQLVKQKLGLTDSEENDEHIQMMTMTHNVFSSVMNVIELLVETRAVRSQLDVNVESQLMLEDIPSSFPSLTQGEPSAYYRPDMNFNNTPDVEASHDLTAIVGGSTAQQAPDNIGCSSGHRRLDVDDDDAWSLDFDFVPEEEISDYSELSGYDEEDDDGDEYGNEDYDGTDNDEEDNRERDVEEEPEQRGPQVVRQYHERAARFMSDIHVERIVEADNLFTEVEMDGVELAEGAIFPTKEALRHAAKIYSIRMHRDYQIIKTSKRYVDYRCTKYPSCRWKIRACKRKMFWEITRYGGPHSCVNLALTQDHRKLKSDIIASFIVNLVSCYPNTPVKAIITAINNEFGYNVSYKKALRGKHKAIAMAFGNWDSSYAMLPRWMAAMQRFMPGTVVEWDNVDHSEDENQVVFRCVFWAYQQSIQGFEHVKPIVQIDGTFLYGKYTGTLLMATSQDGNRKCFPLAFAVVEGETGGAWRFFLRHLRTHVIRTRMGVCLISDRHRAIMSSVADANLLWQPSYAHHVFCIRHLASNLHSEVQKKWLKKLFINIGYDPRRHAVESQLGELRLIETQGADWIDGIPREQWTQAYDGGRRFGHMTTNLAESMNAVFKGVRALPITGLVKATYYRLNTYFTENSRMYEAQLQAGRIYSEKVHDHLNKVANAASGCRVVRFDRAESSFEVMERQDHSIDQMGVAYPELESISAYMLKSPMFGGICCCAEYGNDNSSPKVLLGGTGEYVEGPLGNWLELTPNPPAIGTLDELAPKLPPTLPASP
ncbi:uncharacterized protein G2W53_034264 [Senna tora]|uniref:Transposase n=1 Tax=Senna tora TaxID=362788 RepID=A0A834W9D5_9FABA|nr:uncharacterized protein G2W53_034264 [Senna tora]